MKYESTNFQEFQGIRVLKEYSDEGMSKQYEIQHILNAIVYNKIKDFSTKSPNNSKITIFVDNEDEMKQKKHSCF